MFALRRFHRDHGGLPARLEDLAPTYLDRVPVNPREVEPLRCYPEYKCVDSLDVGGKMHEEIGTGWLISF